MEVQNVDRMKGIVKKPDGKFIAQYWNRQLGENIYIGTYDSEKDAVIHRAIHLAKVYDREIDDSIPKPRRFPKGIDERCGRYRAILQISYGPTGKKQSKSMHIGTFDTVEEAVQARKDFILKQL